MKKGTLFVVGLILFLFTGIIWLSISDVTTAHICKKDDKPIQFKRLSDEIHFPYRGYWGAPNELHTAVTRFPEVRSCLISSEKETQMPNLTSFDWDAIQGTYDARVCLFRVFSSIGSVEGSAQWVKNQGFDVNSTKEIPVEVMRFNGEQRPGLRVDASWSFTECGRMIIGKTLLDPVVPASLFTRLVAHGFWVGAEFSEDGEIIDVLVKFNTK